MTRPIPPDDDDTPVGVAWEAPTGGVIGVRMFPLDDHREPDLAFCTSEPIRMYSIAQAEQLIARWQSAVDWARGKTSAFPDSTARG